MDAATGFLPHYMPAPRGCQGVIGGGFDVDQPVGREQGPTGQKRQGPLQQVVGERGVQEGHIESGTLALAGQPGEGVAVDQGRPAGPEHCLGRL